MAAAAAAGVLTLAEAHEFGGRADLNYSAAEARALLQAARDSNGARGPHAAALLAALMSDAAVKEEKDQIEATPLCLMFGQGHQHFLDRLASVPRMPSPPPRGRGRNAAAVTPEACLEEALFAPWLREDPTAAFRWDPAEDVRYALLADDPSGDKTLTQHGANRLAAAGLAALTVAPVVQRGRVRLVAPGSSPRARGVFRIAWPIWRAPASLEAIRALLCHPDLHVPEALAHLGVEEVRAAERLHVGKFMNFGRARQQLEGREAAP